MNILTGGQAGSVACNLATGIDGSTGAIQIGGGVVGELKSISPVRVGAWHVVVTVFDGAVSRIYVDGILAGKGPVGVASPAAAYLPRLTVGTNTGANTQYFDGDISKINIFGRAFTEADAVALSKTWRAAAGLSA